MRRRGRLTLGLLSCVDSESVSVSCASSFCSFPSASEFASVGVEAAAALVLPVAAAVVLLLELPALVGPSPSSSGAPLIRPGSSSSSVLGTMCTPICHVFPNADLFDGGEMDLRDVSWVHEVPVHGEDADDWLDDESHKSCGRYVIDVDESSIDELVD